MVLCCSRRLRRLVVRHALPIYARSDGAVVISRVLLACLVTAAVSHVAAPSDEEGIGVRFGARDPRTCATTVAPSHGPISATLAAAYLTCAQEGVSGRSLVLLSKLTLRVGTGRRYDRLRDDTPEGRRDGDVVFPISGSYERYVCDAVVRSKGTDSSASVRTAGRNCWVYNHPHASGLCYRTVAASWRCAMADYDRGTALLRNDVAPPL